MRNIILLIGILIASCSGTKPITSNVNSGPVAQTMLLHFETDNEAGVTAFVLEKTVSETSTTWSNVVTISPAGKPNVYNITIPIGSGLYRLKTNRATSVEYSSIINVK